MVFRIDLKIFVLLILFIFTKQIKIYIIMMFFAIIHECSHLLAGILLKMKVKRVTLMPMGLSIEFKSVEKNYKNKFLKLIIIAMAGPISNLLIAFTMMFIKVKFQELVIYSNLLIAIFNLLPIYPLDGGRILKSLLNLLVGKRKAEKYINKIANIVLLVITAFSSILIYYVKNIAIILILIYLWCIVIKENKIYKLKEKCLKHINLNNL